MVADVIHGESLSLWWEIKGSLQEEFSYLVVTF